jgi:hypothetical protein
MLSLCCAAGLCKALLQALQLDIRGTHRSMFDMLSKFVRCLSGSGSYILGMTAMSNSGVVELVAAHLVHAHVEETICGVVLCSEFLGEWGRDRLAALGTVDQVMKWVARCLVEVRSRPPA